MEKYQRERFVGNSQPLTLDVAPAPTLPLSIVQRAKSTYAHCPSCRVPWKTGGQKKTQNGDGMVPRLGISLYFILAYPLNLENVESFIGILFKRPWKSLIFHEMYHWCCPFSTQPCYAVHFLSLPHLSVSSRPFKIFSPQNKAEVYSEYPSGFYEENKTSNTIYISIYTLQSVFTAHPLEAMVVWKTIRFSIGFRELFMFDLESKGRQAGPWHQLCAPGGTHWNHLVGRTIPTYLTGG